MQRDIELEIISLKRVNTELSLLQARGLELEFELNRTKDNLSNENEIVSYEEQKNEFNDVMNQINSILHQKEMEEILLRHARELEYLKSKQYSRIKTHSTELFDKFKAELKKKIEMRNIEPAKSNFKIVKTRRRTKGAHLKQTTIVLPSYVFCVQDPMYELNRQSFNVSSNKVNEDLLGKKTIRGSIMMGVEEKLKLFEEYNNKYESEQKQIKAKTPPFRIGKEFYGK